MSARPLCEEHVCSRAYSCFGTHANTQALETNSPARKLLEQIRQLVLPTAQILSVRPGVSATTSAAPSPEISCLRERLDSWANRLRATILLGIVSRRTEGNVADVCSGHKCNGFCYAGLAPANLAAELRNLYTRPRLVELFYDQVVQRRTFEVRNHCCILCTRMSWNCVLCVPATCIPNRPRPAACSVEHFLHLLP